MSEYDLREKFVNEKLVIRGNPCTLNQGMFMGQRVHGGHVIIEGRTGNKKLKGPIIQTRPNPDLSLWVSKVPKVIRAGAVKDYCDGRKGALENLKAGRIRYFKMSYRKTNDRLYPPLHLEKHVKSCMSGKYIQMFPSILKQSKIANPLIRVNKHDRVFINQYLGQYDCKLKYEYGQWFLLVMYNKTVEKINQERGVCGVDPGIRDPLVLYDADRMVSMSYNKQIHNKLQLRLNLMQSLRARKLISQRSYWRVRWKLKRRWDNLRSDMHYKCASHLVSNYKYIGLPPFETSNMVKKRERGFNLHKKSKIEMLNWSHFKFQQRLKSKCRGLSHVLPVDESYTTQTCTQCGTLKYMGGDKIYHCDVCKLKIDRDFGSARSIFLCTMMRRFIV